MPAPRLGFVQQRAWPWGGAPAGLDLGFDHVELLMDGDRDRTALDPVAGDIRTAAADGPGLDLLVHLPFRLDVGSPAEFVRNGSVRELQACIGTAGRIGTGKGVVHAHSRAWPAVWDRGTVQGHLLDPIRRLDGHGRNCRLEPGATGLFHPVLPCGCPDDCTGSGSARRSGLQPDGQGTPARTVPRQFSGFATVIAASHRLCDVRYRNLALFVLLAVLWGSAFPAIKAGLAYFPPVLFAAVRYDLAGVFMLAYAVHVADRWRPRTAAEWRLVGVGSALMIAGYHAFLFVGEQYTTSAAAAVVVGLSPVLTTGFARSLLPSERLTPVGLVGLFLGLAGVVVVARPDPTNLLSGSALGVLLVFGAAASFALGSVLARRSTADLPIETMEAWSMLGGALALHAISAGLPGESVAAIRWTPEAVAALAYLVGPASALGFLLYFDLLDRLGPVELNLVSYATPVVAALVGWLVLGEVPTVATGVGFLAILAGFLLVKRAALARELPRVRAALR